MSLPVFKPLICGVIPTSSLFVLIFVLLVYFLIIFGICYFFFKWKTQSISLKREQNELLREIIKKLENK